MCNLGYLKIHAEQSEVEHFFKEVSEIVIFRTIVGIKGQFAASGAGGAQNCERTIRNHKEL